MARQGKIMRGEQVVVPECRIANDFLSRFMGLMGKKSVASNAGVLFPKCNSIHTFFMRIPIDVVFLKADGEVVEVLAAFGAWRMLLPRMQAAHTLELGAGQAARLGIHQGQKLSCEGVF